MNAGPAIVIANVELPEVMSGPVAYPAMAGSQQPVDATWPPPEPEGGYQEQFLDLARRDDTLYCAWRAGGPANDYWLRTLDLSDFPTVTELDRQECYQFPPWGGQYAPGHLKECGDRLYLSSRPSYMGHVQLLRVYDITEPVPQYLYTVDHSYGEPVNVWMWEHDFAATEEGWVYVPSWPEGGILVCDCTAENGGAVVRRLLTLGAGITVHAPITAAVHGDILYTEMMDEQGHHLAAYDISERDDPSFISSLLLSPYGTTAYLQCLRPVLEGECLAFVTRPWPMQGVGLVDVRDPQNMGIVDHVDVSGPVKARDADSVEDLYFVHLSLGNWPVPPEWCWYAYGMRLEGSPHIEPVAGGTEHEANVHLGIVGHPLGRAEEEMGMFTDPTGVAWIAWAGQGEIQVARLEQADNAWEVLPVIVNPTIACRSAAITGDGRVLRVTGRESLGNTLYAWYSRDQGASWEGPAAVV